MNVLAGQDAGGLETAVESAGFDHVLTVPCSILRQWYTPSDTLATLYLSREEEGVGVAAGLLAAGRQPLLLIQNSGLGNCVNALGSLAVAYRIPLVVVVSLRGDELDDNPVQAPMGEATLPLVRALGCSWTRIGQASGPRGKTRGIRPRLHPASQRCFAARVALRRVASCATRFALRGGRSPTLGATELSAWATSDVVAALVAARRRAEDAGRPEFVLLPSREFLAAPN